MKNFLFALMVASCMYSCKNEKKDIEEKEPIDVTLRQSNGDPVNTYRDKDGVRWSRYNIFAPKEDESINDEKYQPRGDDGNQYEKGYEDGYEEGYSEGRYEGQ